MPVVGKENKNWKKRNCVECQFESGHSLECSKYKEPVFKTIPVVGKENKNWHLNRFNAVRKTFFRVKKELEHYEYLLKLLSGKRKIQEYQLKDCPRKCCK